MSFGSQLFLDAARCSAWANQSLLESCSALSNEELDRDLRISHVNIIGTLSHIYHGERVWLDCLVTTPDSGHWRLPVGPDANLSLDRLRRDWPDIWDGFSRWLEHKSDAALENELLLHLPGAVQARFPRWKVLRHVLHHSTLHRGQVIGMIRILGHQPPAVSPMDYYLSNPKATPPR